MKGQERSQKTLRVAICAMLSALGVVALYIGALIDVLDISMAVVASLFAIFAVIEYGAGAAWSIYGVTGIISVILLPQKLPAAMYILFFGFYPIIKEKIESVSKKVLQWALKEVVFNLCLVVLMVLGTKLLYLDTNGLFVFEAVFFLLANFTFVIYDIALTRLISLYIYKLRSKFKGYK